MKVDWSRPGVLVAQGKGDDGSQYQVVWYIEEIPVSPPLTGPGSLLGGKYGAFKDGQRIGVYESLSKAYEAIEQM